NLTNCGSIFDVAPPQKMALTTLILQCCPVRKIVANRGSPLQTVNFRKFSTIQDFTQFKGFKVKSLDLAGTRIANLADLKGTALDSLTLDGCALIQDLTAVKELSLSSLSLAGCGSLQDLKPLAGV